MQELSTNLLLQGGLPKSLQIARNKPLPPWLVSIIGDSRDSNRGWWHIYLDNFFSGEKVQEDGSAGMSKQLHDDTERIWEETGVLSSKKKKVTLSGTADELGARFASNEKYLGVSGERLLKVGGFFRRSGFKWCVVAGFMCCNSGVLAWLPCTRYGN